jgi:predicted acylesterase/phospholipase RssA
VSRSCDGGQLVHNVALVLGGDGAAGTAWLIGIIAGLAEAALDMTEAADLVISTSAGATGAAAIPGIVDFKCERHGRDDRSCADRSRRISQ